MVTCPACRIAFNPSYKVCPCCRRFEVPLEEFTKSLESEAEAQLESGRSLREVEEMLIAGGLAEENATQLAAMYQQKVARRTRSHGLRRFLTGVGSVGLGFLGLFLHPIVGVGLLIFGGFAIFSGLSSAMTGRESRIAAPDAVKSLFHGNE
jgi:hypothetical protein